MNELTIIENTALQASQSFNAEYFSRWTSYIDAKPRTIETYTKAIKQFFAFMLENGIRQPQREDIVA